MGRKKELTERQRAFINAYLGEARFNASEAARIAGYPHPYAQSCVVRKAPLVAREIEARLRQLAVRDKNAITHIMEQIAIALPEGQGGRKYRRGGRPAYDLLDMLRSLRFTGAAENGGTGTFVPVGDKGGEPNKT